MITKEELLQKGIDASEADKIISALEAQVENSSPLEALNKALNEDSEMDSLFKAAKKGEDDGDDEDDDGEEYDEKFMKKHKKFMKKLGKSDDGDEDDEKGGNMFGKEMKKAFDGISDAEGAVVDMADLTPVLDAMVETVQTMAKAISGLERKIEVISSQNSESYSLLAKAAAVTAETAEIVTGMGNAPVGRKGALVADMQKAKAVPSVDIKKVWETLAKAINTGDLKAGAIGSKFESSGKRFAFLSDEEQGYVKELMTKEANS